MPVNAVEGSVGRPDLNSRSGVVVESHSRSILRSPCAGVHHSTTSIVASSLRWVCTTSAMSAWKRRSGSDRPAGDLRLPRPLRLGALDRVDRGAVQGEPRVPAQVRALARVRHRANDQFAVLEDRLDPGDSRRSVGSQGGHCLVSVSVEQLVRHPATPSRAHDRTDRRQHGPGFSRPRSRTPDQGATSPIAASEAAGQRPVRTAHAS